MHTAEPSLVRCYLSPKVSKYHIGSYEPVGSYRTIALLLNLFYGSAFYHLRFRGFTLESEINGGRKKEKEVNPKSFPHSKFIAFHTIDLLLWVGFFEKE